MSSSGSGGVRELVPGRLWALGGTAPLDGAITWAPGDHGFVALNCYLLIERDQYMLIDPGPVVHQTVLLEQLKDLLPDGAAISIFLTRAELDTFGALGALSARYRVRQLLAGGGHNPFDQFDYVSGVGPGRRGEYVKTARVPGGTEFAVGYDRNLIVVRPALRLLATFWGYDTGTGSLFTSDVFTHGTGGDMASAWSLDTTGDAPVDLIADHLAAKFWWMRYAQMGAIHTDLSAI